MLREVRNKKYCYLSIKLDEYVVICEIAWEREMGIVILLGLLLKYFEHGEINIVALVFVALLIQSIGYHMFRIRGWKLALRKEGYNPFLLLLKCFGVNTLVNPDKRCR